MDEPKKAPAKKAPARARKRSTGGARKAAEPAPKKGNEVAAPASMTMVRVGTYDYPLVSNPRCNTCQSPHRRWIENELLLGRSYASIAERLLDMDTGRSPRPTVIAMRGHVESGHTPAPAKVRRQIMDRRAREIGAKIDGDDSIVDHVTINSMMLQQAHEDLMAGKVNLSASDITAIIGTRMRIEETSKDGYDSEVMEAALFAQMEAAMSMIGPDQLQEYARRVEGNPILRAASKRLLDQQALDAEVVGED